MEYMKKKKFKIALAQIKIEQKNIEENCKKIFKKIEEAAKENVDIICFPELATIGYTITTDELQNLPEDFENTFIEKLQEKARLFKIHICKCFQINSHKVFKRKILLWLEHS